VTNRIGRPGTRSRAAHAGGGAQNPARRSDAGGHWGARVGRRPTERSLAEGRQAMSGSMRKGVAFTDSGPETERLLTRQSVQFGQRRFLVDDKMRVVAQGLQDTRRTNRDMRLRAAALSAPEELASQREGRQAAARERVRVAPHQVSGHRFCEHARGTVRPVTSYEKCGPIRARSGQNGSEERNPEGRVPFT